MGPSRPGYTLFEMILVLAIIIIVLAIAFPTLEDMYDGQKMLSGTDAVRSHWALARSRAIDEGRPYRFALVPGTGNFRIAPDSGDYWTGGGSTLPDDPANPPLDLCGQLPKGVRFSSAGTVGLGGPVPSGDSSMPAEGVDPSMWVSTVVFLPDGTAFAAGQEDVTVVLEMRGVQPYMLNLRTLTGVVTVRPYLAEGQQP